MKIRKLQLKTIGVFDDETIEFHPCPEGKAEIHIFTGQNGTGKTTLLMALSNSFGYFNFVENSSRNPDPIIYESFDNFMNSSFNKRWKLGGKLRTSFNDSFPVEIEFNITTKYQIPRKIFNYSKLLLRKEINFAPVEFAVFAFSGYRQIETEIVQANYLPKDYNPLSQSLEFVKDYRNEGEVTINQLVANNISNRALSKEDGSLEEAKRYENVIDAIETFIKDVTDYEVKVILKRSPNELKLRMHDEELDFDVLPDGLRSLISWIADLLGKIDMLNWQDNLPITEKNMILLLDEIEVHLHPAWQRKVLPVIQKLFKNAQIFVSTHSPFIVNSIDDAWVYKLEFEGGRSKVSEIVESENSNSITQVLREIFGVDYWFGWEVQKNFDEFKRLKNKIISNGADTEAEKGLLEKARLLAEEPNDQLKQLIREELEDLSETKQKSYSL